MLTWVRSGGGGGGGGGPWGFKTPRKHKAVSAMEVQRALAVPIMPMNASWMQAPMQTDSAAVSIRITGSVRFQHPQNGQQTSIDG